MKYHVHKAVVIGAGTMGAALAAHFANAGIPVTLLDIVPKDAPEGDKKARNKIVQTGWDACLKAKPSARCGAVSSGKTLAKSASKPSLSLSPDLDMALS